MYQRDTDVEMKETLARLSIAFDRLIEVVAKDETSKSILESLKEKGAKDVKEVPTSDVRAEDIKVTQGNRSRSASTADATLNYSTMNRLNTAFRALQGDLGAFQKTLMNSVVWGNKAQSLAQKVASITPEQLQSPIKSYKQAEKWFLDKMGGDRSPEAYKALGDRLAPSGEELFKFLQAGFDPKDAGKVLTKRNKEALIREAQAATMRPVIKPGTAAGTVTSVVDMAAIAAAAAKVVLISAPMTAGRFVHDMATNQIEGNRPFSMLNANLATEYAQYDMNKLLTNMRYAKGISSSMKGLLESESQFQKLSEPFRTLSGNVSNIIATSGMEAVNFAIKPFSKLVASFNNSNNRAKGFLEEALAGGAEGAGIGALLGGIFGGIAGAPGGIAGIAAGAAWGAALGGLGGGIGGAAIGGFGEVIGQRRRKELDDIFGDAADKSKRGMIFQFAQDIAAIPVCPPRRFVP